MGSCFQRWSQGKSGMGALAMALALPQERHNCRAKTQWRFVSDRLSSDSGCSWLVAAALACDSQCLNRILPCSAAEPVLQRGQASRRQADADLVLPSV